MQNTEIEYVVGFWVSPDKKKILLIQKNKPVWQAGKLNGIGGQINSQEHVQAAMCREFEEESGVATLQGSWKNFLIQTGKDYILYCFVRFEKIPSFKSQTEELINVYNLENLPKNIVNNLTWMLNKALKNKHTEII